jgi:hypothetical protein
MFGKAKNTRTKITNLPAVPAEELARIEGGGRIGDGVLVGVANALGKQVAPTASMGANNSADSDHELI